MRCVGADHPSTKKDLKGFQMKTLPWLAMFESCRFLPEIEEEYLSQGDEESLVGSGLPYRSARFCREVNIGGRIQLMQSVLQLEQRRKSPDC